jgi:hypothetical protein
MLFGMDCTKEIYNLLCNGRLCLVALSIEISRGNPLRITIWCSGKVHVYFFFYFFKLPGFIVYVISEYQYDNNMANMAIR